MYTNSPDILDKIGKAHVVWKCLFLPVCCSFRFPCVLLVFAHDVRMVDRRRNTEKHTVQTNTVTRPSVSCDSIGRKMYLYPCRLCCVALQKRNVYFRNDPTTFFPNMLHVRRHWVIEARMSRCYELKRDVDIRKVLNLDGCFDETGEENRIGLMNIPNRKQCYGKYSVFYNRVEVTVLYITQQRNKGIGEIASFNTLNNSGGGSGGGDGDGIERYENISTAWFIGKNGAAISLEKQFNEMFGGYCTAIQYIWNVNSAHVSTKLMSIYSI